MMMNGLWNTPTKLVRSATNFIKSWQEQTPPPPKGKHIYSSPSREKISNLFQGYHVTQMKRVKDQIPKGAFDNRNRHIYWYPKLEPRKREKSPLLFGGGGPGPGCWNAEDPVIVKVGSNQTPQWNKIHNFPFFPRGENQDVKILDVWECNEQWLQDRRERKKYPSLSEKFTNSLEEAKKVIKSENE